MKKSNTPKFVFDPRKACRTDGKVGVAAYAGAKNDTGCGWSGCGRCYEY